MTFKTIKKNDTKIHFLKNMKKMKKIIYKYIILKPL